MRVRGGKRKVEGRAFTHLAFSPNPAAMAVDDALDNGQAQAGANEFPAKMQALEYLKQSVGIIFVKADAAGHSSQGGRELLYQGRILRSQVCTLAH